MGVRFATMMRVHQSRLARTAESIEMLNVARIFNDRFSSETVEKTTIDVGSEIFSVCVKKPDRILTLV